MEISMAVAVADEVEDNRKKQGDIIAIKEGGWQWGSGEVKNHLILEFSLPLSATMDMAINLVSTYFAGGILNWEGTSPTILEKRRFKVDWATLKSVILKAGIIVDWKKVEDKTIAYQPLSVQSAAPGGQKAVFDPTKLIFDKYEARLITVIDFGSFITG
jgi:hypothetical protein